MVCAESADLRQGWTIQNVSTWQITAYVVSLQPYNAKLHQLNRLGDYTRRPPMQVDCNNENKIHSNFLWDNRNLWCSFCVMWFTNGKQNNFWVTIDLVSSRCTFFNFYEKIHSGHSAIHPISPKELSQQLIFKGLHKKLAYAATNEKLKKKETPLCYLLIHQLVCLFIF